MEFVKDARVLVDYIQCLESFNTISVERKPVYNHIGALFTDIVLQAGLNYKSVVRPRVIRILNEYPNANTVAKFDDIISEVGLEKLINWRHPVKIQRVLEVVNFSKDRDIDTCQDLLSFLSITPNHIEFLKINGFGFKTLDYTLKLLSHDTVAVDRHIVAFINQAGLTIKDYHSVKKVVEYAADFMNISRTSIDYSIWNYMSKNSVSSRQVALF